MPKTLMGGSFDWVNGEQGNNIRSLLKQRSEIQVTGVIELHLAYERCHNSVEISCFAVSDSPKGFQSRFVRLSIVSASFDPSERCKRRDSELSQNNPIN